MTPKKDGNVGGPDKDYPNSRRLFPSWKALRMRVSFEDPIDLLVQEEIEGRRPELATMLAGRDAVFVRTTMT